MRKVDRRFRRNFVRGSSRPAWPRQQPRRSHPASRLTPAPARARFARRLPKNLALFQQSQKHWFEVQRCDSCHHQYQPALAYRSAREHGIPFDESIARDDAAKAFTYADLDRAVQYSWIIEPAVDDALPADRGRCRRRPAESRDRRHGARPGGRGRTAAATGRAIGSVRRRRTATSRSRRSRVRGDPAVQPSDAEGRTSRSTSRWRAAGSSRTRPSDTEERIYQLLGLKWTGADRATLTKLLRATRARRRKPTAAGARSTAASATRTRPARRSSRCTTRAASRSSDAELAARHRLPAQDAGGRRIVARRDAALPAGAAQPAVLRERPAVRTRSVSVGAGRRVGRHGADARSRAGTRRDAGAAARCRAGERRAVGRNGAVRERGRRDASCSTADSIRTRRRSRAARQR